MDAQPNLTSRWAMAQERRAANELTIGIEEEISRLHRLSAWKRLAEVSLFVGIYAAGAVLVFVLSGNTIATLCGVFLMGLALNAAGILIHEGLHGLLARDKRVNHVCSFLCGLPLLISATAYRVTHTNHHFEFGRKLDYGTYKQHLGNKHLVWLAYFLQLFFGSIIYMVCIPPLAFKSGSSRDRAFILLEYCLIASAIAALVIFVPWHAALMYWLYPSIVVMLLTNLRGLASHALGDLDDIYLSSRTVESSPLISLLFLHENYHLEHHLFPQVPSYNLKAVHQLVWDRLPRALHADSYKGFLISFFKSAAHLSLKPCGLVFPSRKIKP